MFATRHVALVSPPLSAGLLIHSDPSPRSYLRLWAANVRIIHKIRIQFGALEKAEPVVVLRVWEMETENRIGWVTRTGGNETEKNSVE